MKDTFDLKKFLVENKITTASKLLKEDLEVNGSEVEGSLPKDIKWEQIEELERVDQYDSEWIIAGFSKSTGKYYKASGSVSLGEVVEVYEPEEISEEEYDSLI